MRFEKQALARRPLKQQSDLSVGYGRRRRTDAFSAFTLQRPGGSHRPPTRRGVPSRQPDAPSQIVTSGRGPSPTAAVDKECRHTGCTSGVGQRVAEQRTLRTFVAPHLFGDLANESNRSPSARRPKSQPRLRCPNPPRWARVRLEASPRIEPVRQLAAAISRFPTALRPTAGRPAVVDAR